MRKDAPTFHLNVDAGVQQGQEWRLCPTNFTVGADPSCDLILVDCAPGSIHKVTLDPHHVTVGGLDGGITQFRFGEPIALSGKSSILMQLEEPESFVAKHIDGIGKAIRDVDSKQRFKFAPIALVAGFVFTAAMASDFLSTGSQVDQEIDRFNGKAVASKVVNGKTHLDIVFDKKSDLEKYERESRASRDKSLNLKLSVQGERAAVSNFDKPPTASAPTMANGSLERLLGCAKSCFDKEQVAALIPGEQGSVQLRDGRKLRTGSMVSDVVVVESVGDGYIMFGDGNQSVRVEVF